MKLDSTLAFVLTMALLLSAGFAEARTPQSDGKAQASEDVGSPFYVAGSIGEHLQFSGGADEGLPSASATVEVFDMLTRETDALLRWTTSLERNNAGFEIEYRLVDADMEFQSVGFVAGAGDSDERNVYRFGVKNLLAGEHEFRLKITSRTGTTTLSRPVRIAVGTRPAFALGEGAHDPATGVVYVPYTLSDSGIVRLIVQDAEGKLAATLAFGTHEAGTHVAYFNSAIVAGPGYTIHLHTERGSASRAVCLECVGE